MTTQRISSPHYVLSSGTWAGLREQEADAQFEMGEISLLTADITLSHLLYNRYMSLAFTHTFILKGFGIYRTIRCTEGADESG